MLFRSQLLLDALADDLQVQVGQEDLTERLVATSRQYGIEPQQLFAYLQENNQLPAMFADVRRGLAVAAAVEASTVTDTDGNAVDTSDFFGKRGAEASEQAGAEPAGEAEEADKSSAEADKAEPAGEAEEADKSSAEASEQAGAEAEVEAPDASDDEAK